MRIVICDICKKKGKLVEGTKSLKIKGRAFLGIDHCGNHDKEIPKDIIDFVKFVYRLDGVELKETDEEIREKFLRK